MVDRDPRTYAIIGAAMAVHRALGCGFLEAVYHEALAIESELRSISFKHEVQLPMVYRGRTLQTVFRADFVCYNSVVIEIKAQAMLNGAAEAQLINYLKATQQDVGLLLNYGGPSLEYRRCILSAHSKSAKSAQSAETPSP